MPIHKCKIDGKSGWKWGKTGKCYTGPDAKQKAIAQAIAASGGEAPINEKLYITKTSFDWDGTLDTPKGKELWKNTGGDKWIITARQPNRIADILKWANENGVPRDRVIAVGSNPAKIQKIKDLKIETHWDNNVLVISKLPGIGKKI